MNLAFPPLSGKGPHPKLPEAHQITIIGAPGSGKTRFMEALVELNSARAYCLNAVSAPFPEREESQRPGSVDMLFREAARRQPYMRTDAVSELDKLAYMLIIDEFDSLLTLKELQQSSHRFQHPEPTRLDLLARLWEKVFPGNRIVRTREGLMFATSAGDDLIPVESLSQGEKSVLYYVAAVLYAMPGAAIFIDSPSLFLHPSILSGLWNSIEELRPDCTFIYNSVDVSFVASRTKNVCVWVKSFDAATASWDYEVIQPGDLREEIFVDLVGTRKPVLFIEGDMSHSIDARLYPLVFPDCTVRPLGSCDKVIETTRTFNDLKTMHHLESRGIVDRDRRTDPEVEYLRRKSVMVPEVAEVENLFLLEGVVKAMARRRGRDPHVVFERIRTRVENEFRSRFDEQVLQHVRHRIKRQVECKIDGRFSCITALELHLKSLPSILRPREQYDSLREQFHSLLENRDYAGILKVFNHKPMLNDSGVAQALGFSNRDDYVSGVIMELKQDSQAGQEIRMALRRCLRVGEPLPEKPARVEKKAPEPKHEPADRRNGRHPAGMQGDRRATTKKKSKRRKNNKRRHPDV